MNLGRRRDTPLFEGGPTGGGVPDVFDLHSLPGPTPFRPRTGCVDRATESLNRYPLAARRVGACNPRRLSTFHVRCRHIAHLPHTRAEHQKEPVAAQ